MFNKTVKKIKVLFSLIALWLALSIGGGAFIFKMTTQEAGLSPYFTRYYFQKQKVYLAYKWQALKDRGLSTPVALASLMVSEPQEQSLPEGTAESVPVLIYHGVINEADGSNIVLEDFKKHMFALKAAGYQTITLKDFYDFLQGRKPVPQKSFLLTFDDGRKDSYYPVDPILRVLGFNAVAYVVTKYSLGHGSSYYLSLGEIKEMSRTGRWEVQSHGDRAHEFYPISADGISGHFMSDRLWLGDRLENDAEFRERIYRDLADSKHDLEEKLDQEMLSYAFPFGDFGQDSHNFPGAEELVLSVARSVYPMTFYQVRGNPPYKANYQKRDQFHVGRIEVGHDWSVEELLSILEKTTDKSLSYHDTFESDRGWISNWGLSQVRDQQLSIMASGLTNGSLSVLDGSYLWQDYVSEARLAAFDGQVFGLVARHQDNNNYVSCNFSDYQIAIQQKRRGEQKTLVVVRNTFGAVAEGGRFGIKVEGDRAFCLMGGSVVAANNELNLIDPALSHGGVGFLTWDPVFGQSALTVRELTVADVNLGL